MRERAPSFTIDPIAAAEVRRSPQALAWAKPLLGERPILISATAPPDEVAEAQRRLGRERAGAVVEETLAAIARGLVDGRRAAAGRRRRRDRGRGGPGARRHRIAHRPADRSRRAVDGQPRRAALALALKSGNFGAPDFFLRAFSVLSEGATR